MSDFQLDFNRSKGIRVRNVLDHFIKPVTDEQYQSLLDDELILESCTLDDIENTLFLGVPAVQDMILEAITSTSVRLKNTMTAFVRSLNKATTPAGITVSSDVEISAPRKSGMVAVMTSKMNLSDGQSISIVFHAPDNDPLKINPGDTLIAFRFLLNSRDVTHVVASSGGKDLSLAQATMALSNLVERNSEKFKSKQGEKVSQKKEIDDSERQALEVESTLASISNDIDQVNDSITTTNSTVVSLQKRIDRENVTQEKLRAELAALTPPAATTTVDVPSAGGNGGSTPTPTPANSDKFVKHSRSKKGNVVYTRDIGDTTYYFAKATYAISGDSYTPSTSRKGWLWATQLDDSGDPDMRDTYYAGDTRENAYKQAMAKDGQRKQKEEYATKELLPQYQELLNTTGNQFVDAYKSGDQKELVRLAKVFQDKVWGLEIKDMPNSMMPIKAIGTSDETAKYAVERFAKLGITGTQPTPSVTDVEDVIDTLSVTDVEDVTDTQGQSELNATFTEFMNLDGALARDIARSLKVIGQVDAGTDRGMDRSLFVSSIVNKLKTQFKNGNQDVVDAALAHIKAFNEFNGKPAITDRNGVWKLHSSIQNPTPEPTPEPTQTGRVIKLLESFEFDGSYFIYSRNVNEHAIKVTERDSGESFITDTDEPMINGLARDGIKFEGIDYPKIEAELEAELDTELSTAIEVFKQLDLSQHIHDGGTLTFDGQDELQDSLVRAGISATPEMINGFQQSKAKYFTMLINRMLRDGELTTGTQTAANSPLDTAIESLTAMAAYTAQTVPGDITEMNTFFTNWLNDINAAIATIMEADKADEYDPLMNEVADLYTALSKETR